MNSILFELAGVKTQKLYTMKVWATSAFANQKVFVFESQFLLNITPKEQQISPVTKFHKLEDGHSSLKRTRLRTVSLLSENPYGKTEGRTQNNMSVRV